MTTKLSVNLNKIALIRNSREGNYPDLTDHGRSCLEAGADGLTVHPRPDQRHIRPGDLTELSQLLQDWPGIEFNVEGNPFAQAQGSYPGFLPLVLAHKPDQCTLVPDSNDQLTSDHGFDLSQSSDDLTPVIHRLQDAGIRVSLFMDPNIEQIERAKELGVERIELYTGPYAWTHRKVQGQETPELEALFADYRAAAVRAHELGIGINAGHDLNLENLAKFLTIPNILEVSIGHALTVDALAMGLQPAVRAYRDICQQNSEA